MCHLKIQAGCSGLESCMAFYGLERFIYWLSHRPALSPPGGPSPGAHLEEVTMVVLWSAGPGVHAW